jgi:hypothetical protein
LDLRAGGWFGADRSHGRVGHGRAGQRGSADTTTQESRGRCFQHGSVRHQLSGQGLRWLVNFPVGTTTLRDGPSNGCIETGEGLHDQRAQYFCYLPGDGGTWTLLRNVSTGEQGWVRDDLLPGDGSNVPCEQDPPPASVNGA